MITHTLEAETPLVPDRDLLPITVLTCRTKLFTLNWLGFITHPPLTERNRVAAAIIIAFFLAVALAVWAAIVALSGRTPRWVRVLYLCCFAAAIAAAIAAYFTTFRCVHYVSPNTRFHGWPIPTVVFQRNSPTSPWLDFVGPTVILAYLMNLLCLSYFHPFRCSSWCRSRSRTQPK